MTDLNKNTGTVSADTSVLNGTNTSGTSTSAPTFNMELDKLGTQELSLTLRQMIRSSYDHISDDKRHITDEERQAWDIIRDYPEATITTKGMMSPQDKLKLDDIEDNANNYVHPTYPKLGANGGHYLAVDVNKYGHVTAGYNPDFLDIRVNNSDRLGGKVAAEYATLASPYFLGSVNIPTPGDKPLETESVNIKWFRDNNHPYILQEETPLDNDYKVNLFWIGPKNVLNYYTPDRKWNSVYTEAAYFQPALNENITTNTRPDDYASYFKFIGVKDISALKIDEKIIGTHPEDSKAVIFGMKAEDDGMSYEFIFIDKDLYVRMGDKTDGWQKTVKVLDSDDILDINGVNKVDQIVKEAYGDTSVDFTKVYQDSLV